jgi:hypothetical protein
MATLAPAPEWTFVQHTSNQLPNPTTSWAAVAARFDGAALPMFVRREFER